MASSESADIVISEFMAAAAVESLCRNYRVYYDATLVDHPAELAVAIGAARALIVRNRTRVDRRLLDAAPRLRVVGRLGVGLDNIDLDACDQHGVLVKPATGANDVAVAEYVLTSALLLLRQAYGNTAAVAAGDWPRASCIGRELFGKSLGLVGFGGIARQIATRAAALGLRVCAYDPQLAADDPAWADAAEVDFDTLLSDSDIVSLHVPLTDQTRGMIDATAIAKLKPGAILINTSRGGVVDEAALVRALRQGRLGGAALDVYAEEPLDESTGARFRDVPGLLLTPHIAGVTEESNTRVSALTADQVRAVLESRR